MKEIKDYLPFYLGCQAKVIFARNEAAPEIGELIEVGKNMAFVETGKHEYYECMPYEVKPILRPLSDMTEEEAIEVLRYDKAFHRDYCGWLADFVKWEKQKVYNPNEFAKLLSKHFDLFGLIEDGLAIDKTKINNHE